MLQTLNIQNFALIESLKLEFNKGFTVFTGETGSGKSIILGALNLLLGERADYSVIRNPEKKTVVEGEFDLTNYQLESFFTENDIDYYQNTIIRREILNQGKSRAFVNDTPIQLSVLKELSEKLIHIHSQHNTLSLKESTFQFDFIDYLSGAITERLVFTKKFKNLQSLEKERNDIQQKREQLKQQEDFNSFQLNELRTLNLETENYELLIREFSSMENIDKIKEIYSILDFQLNADDSIVDRVNYIKGILEKNKNYHSDFEELLSHFTTVSSELKEILFQIDKQKDKIETDPEKKQFLESKISNYNSILLKHRVSTQNDLISIYENLSNLNNLSGELDGKLETLSKEIELLQNELNTLDTSIQKTRIQASTNIETQIIQLLSDLKMPHTNFKFSFEALNRLTEYGSNKISILFSPNLGLELKPIEKIASGGELSRLMLCIQLLLSEKKQLPSIIFDEIDTGVSGDVAQKMGELLKKMGQKMQVISITHLPQVAAKGDHQFKVSKQVVNNETITSVDKLTQNERIHEIARLMSGENITESAIQNANELIKA